MRGVAERVDGALKCALGSLRDAFEMFEVVETEEVQTATVTGRAVPVLKINPRFVAEHCPTPQSLAALLMHEALHVVLGHASRGGRTPPLDDVVEDAIINSILCRMRPEPEWTSLFTGLYSEADPVECFLRPAPGFDPPRSASLPAAFAARPRSRGASLHRSLYGRQGVPESDLRAYLAEKVKPGLLFLGGHGEAIDGTESGANGRDEGQARFGEDDVGSGRTIAREALASFGAEVEKTAARALPGWGGAVVERVVKTEAMPRRILADLIRRVGGNDVRTDGTSPLRDTGDLEVLGVLPAPDRRSVLWLGAGASPLLFRRRSLEPAHRRSGQSVHLYLDVSGSVESLLGRLYAAVRDVGELVGRDVHLFSTSLQDLSVRDLAKGACRTTGGTSIVPVTRHIRENGVRRAVIVTDGEVGIIGPADRETLEKTILGVALTSGRERDGDLARLATHVVVLPGL